MAAEPLYLPEKFRDRLQLSLEETAEALNYSKNTLYRMVAARELPCVGKGRLRRIAVADIIAWQRRNRQEGE
jgi:excisionase family DNA binding protein